MYTSVLLSHYYCSTPQMGFWETQFHSHCLVTEVHGEISFRAKKVARFPNLFYNGTHFSMISLIMLFRKVLFRTKVRKAYLWQYKNCGNIVRNIYSSYLKKNSVSLKIVIILCLYFTAYKHK